MVSPVAYFLFRDVEDVELGALWEVEASDLADAGFFFAVGDVDAFVDGKAVDAAVLVVDVGAEGGDAVGAEGDGVGGFVVDFFVFGDAGEVIGVRGRAGDVRCICCVRDVCGGLICVLSHWRSGLSFSFGNLCD